MRCPVCKADTIILELDMVEVDYCRKCKGIWLDSGELEILLEMAGATPGPLTDAVRSGGHKAPAQRRRCPLCRAKMLQVKIEGPPRVVVDRCPRRHGLWLDDRELGHLVEGAGGSPEVETIARLCGRLLRTDRPGAETDLSSRVERSNVGTNPSQ